MIWMLKEISTGVILISISMLIFYDLLYKSERIGGYG